jgi:small-conductance mechanosensitive channel
MNLILQPWLWSALLLVGAVLIAFLSHFAVFAAGKRIARQTQSVLHDSLVRHGRGPAKLIFPLVALLIAVPLSKLPHNVIGPVQHGVGIGIIVAVAWLSIALLGVMEDVATAKLGVSKRDNLTARKVQTQIHVLRRIAVVVIGILALAIILMTFPSIRTLGGSLLASAGLAGLIVGLAARPTLASLLAGLQIALTEPIRMDDVVIVEGEWGRIEEVGTTYVVVRIWDLRRLVVPLSYFIEKPFQNWTRTSADLLGTVFLYTDYTVSVEAIRQKLHETLKSSGMWDGKVWGLQVTDAKEHTLELRALMSAPDSSTAWDLRCYVRENLIGYLQERYPHCLPQTRVQMQQTAAS